MATANIFNIQHFSVHDGPGVRTVVFFKGCSLHCLWCHNPESIHREKEIMLYSEKCIGCMTCAVSCPVGAHSFENGVHRIEKEKCVRCFKCCEECYADALVSVGEERNTYEIFAEICRNEEYFRQSHGGVTFSGGECMLQQTALIELLTLCRERKIHTAIDTAGNVPWEYFENVRGLADLFLYDIKAFDSEVHRVCTGSGNERILDNFRRLAATGAKIIVRIPYIPECNGTELEKISRFLKDYPEIRAELLPYHSMGNSKYHALMNENVFSATVPDKKTVAELKQKYHFV